MPFRQISRVSCSSCLEGRLLHPGPAMPPKESPLGCGGLVPVPAGAHCHFGGGVLRGRLSLLAGDVGEDR
jgi:hypothetical protein